MNPIPFPPNSPGNPDAAAPRADSLTVCRAAGMVMVQLEVSIAVADARLRSYAVAEHRPLCEVARDIVSRRLRLNG